MRAIGTVKVPSAARCANSGKASKRWLEQVRGLVEGVADAELASGLDVGDREDAPGVAAGDLDQVGQRAADRGGVEDEVDRAVADRLHPLHHAVAVGGDGGAELAQPLGVGGAGGGDHPQAATSAICTAAKPMVPPAPLMRIVRPGVRPSAVRCR